MSFKLPRIYPITDTNISNLTQIEQLKLLIEGGAEIVQIREKNLSAKDFFLQASESVKIAREKNVRLIVNDRIDIALVCKADGVHLGQEDLPPQYAREMLENKAVIGFSTHNVAQAIEALKLPIDYIAIGPVFDTKTKKNPDAVVGIEGVRLVRQAVGNFPLVAIGGINLENASQVFAAGADSIAIIGGLLSDGEKIVEKMQKLSQL